MKLGWCHSCLLTLLLFPPPVFGIDMFLSETMPWAFKKSEGAAFDGIGVRMVREISRRSGMEFTLHILPSARHMSQFKTMDQALSLAMQHNFKDTDGPVMAVIARSSTVVMMRPGSPARTYEDLIPASQELGIGVLRGLTYKPLTEDKRIRKVPINDVPSGLRMLASGRLAGIAGSQPLLIANARHLNLKDFPGPLVIIGETSFVLRKRPNSLDSTSHRKIKDAIRSMHRDGTVERIFQSVLNDKDL